MIYLDLDDLLHVANAVLPEVLFRDAGMLEAALARPQATAFGEPAYPDLLTQAAALMHSLARNLGLIDGNKRLTLASTIAFLGLNGRRLDLSNDEAYELVMAVSQGEIEDVDVIATLLRTSPR